MLYESPHCPPPDARQLLLELSGPLHYLEQAARLHALHHRCGMSLADMCRATGWPVRLIGERMSLMALDGGLRTLLMAEGAPERIALALLRLPDAVTRRRIARRIIRERLCIRDAALLVDAALHRAQKQPEPPVRRGRVISLVRDPRPYRNAVRRIAEQMQSAGVLATFTESRSGRRLEWTIALPLRNRRTDRRQSM